MKSVDVLLILLLILTEETLDLLMEALELVQFLFKFLLILPTVNGHFNGLGSEEHLHLEIITLALTM